MENSDSDTTRESIDFDAVNECGFGFRLDCGRGSVVSRFMSACKELVSSIEASDIPYFIHPVVIAVGVTADALEELPTHYKSFRVSCGFADGNIFITDLSYSAPHAYAVRSVDRQTNAWNSGRGFVVSSDLQSGVQWDANAPDLTVSLGDFIQPEQLRGERLIIVKVEVSNRSVREMRERYWQYFERHPTLYSVLGIQFFGDAEHPGKRAVAVQWVRLNGVISVRGQWDFGTVAISVQAIDSFDADLGPRALPPVPHQAWPNSRYPPIHPAVQANLPDRDAVRAYYNSLGVLEVDQLYPNGAPVVTFAAAEMLTFFHFVVPPHLPPLPALEDFTLNLGSVFHEVVYGV